MNRLRLLATCLICLGALVGCVTQTPASQESISVVSQDSSIPQEEESLPEESLSQPESSPQEEEASPSLPESSSPAEQPLPSQAPPAQPEPSASEPPPESTSQEEPQPEEVSLPPTVFSSPEPPDSGTLFSSSDRGVTGDIDTAAFEQELLRLINAERSANGREPLGLEENMQWAARIRAPEVLQDLSHTRPDGTSYYTAFDEAGFAYAGKWHGENVSNMYFSPGYFTTDSAAAYMFNQLKSSPGHYTNMLNENFAQIGIGVYVQEDQDGMIRIASAQMFAGL